LSYPFVSCPVIICPVLSYLVHFRPVLSLPVPPLAVLSCPVLSCPVLSCSAMLCSAFLSCSVLFDPPWIVMCDLTVRIKCLTISFPVVWVKLPGQPTLENFVIKWLKVQSTKPGHRNNAINHFFMCDRPN
jgi:hypothetical protein